MGVGTVVAVTVAVLLIGIPTPFLSKAIAKRFETVTGYRLQIAGTAKIRVLPSMVVTVSDIAVLDSKASSAQPHFTAEGVRIKMSLWGLITGRPRLREVAIAGPTLRVPLLRERLPSASPAASSKSGGAVLPEKLIVDRLVVEEGAVEFFSEANRVESRIDQIDLTGSLSGDHLLAVKASGRMGEQVVRAEVKGKLPAGRLDGQNVALEFSAEAPGLLQDAVTGKAVARTDGALFTINPLAGTIGQSKFAGLVSVDFASKPVVKMDLDFQRLALAVGGGTAAAGPSGLDQPWSDKKVSLDGLNYFDAEVQVSAAELRVDRFRFAPISVGAILRNGVVTAGVTRTGVYGGQVQGTIAVDASGADPNRDPSHALRLDLIGVRALPLLSDVVSFDAIDGRMQAKIDARGRGASLRAIMSTLSGAVDLLVEDGELRSVNIARMIRSLTSSTLNGWQENRAERTDLSQLSAFFRIDRGQAATDNFRMLGPLVRVTGTGTADLAAKTLQFKVDPKLVLSLEGQGGALDPMGIGVPVAVNGPWGSPRIYPDMAGILENPDAAYAKLRELGSGLFGTGTGTGLPGSPGNPLAKSIENLIEQSGGAPTTAEKSPLPRPAPQQSSRAQAPPPAQPASPPPSQSTSQGGPIEFFGKLLFGR